MKKPYRRKVHKRRSYHRGKRCSKGEKKVAVLLERNHLEFEMEKTFDGCKSPKNRPLRFDFYLPEYQLCIEYHGQHHYGPVNKYYKAKLAHERTVIHDKIKKDWLFKNGIFLIEIPHWNFEIFEDPLIEYLTKIYNGTRTIIG